MNYLQTQIKTCLCIAVVHHASGLAVGIIGYLNRTTRVVHMCEKL